MLFLPGAYNSIRESYDRSTAAQRRVDATTDTVRSSQQVRRAVDDLLRSRQDEFDNGYGINNVSLTNISIHIDTFRVKIRDLNDVVRNTDFFVYRNTSVGLRSSSRKTVNRSLFFHVYCY